MTETFYITDLKLAAILRGLGVPKRASDEVTCEVVDQNGRPFRLYKFWFDIGDPEKKVLAKTLMEAYLAAWGELKLPIDHPLYYMKGALDNREAYMDMVKKDVESMKTIEIGNLHVTMSIRASEATKEKIKKFVKELA